MAEQDWDLTAEGMITLVPVIDWHIANMGLVTGVRLSTAHLQDGQPQVRHIQFGLPPDEAKRLGQALCLAADRISDSRGTS